MTRKSTPKFEVVHLASGTVALTGISKTEATKIARAMNKGTKPHQRCTVRRKKVA